MSFGWSIGDLVAAIQLIVKVANALDEVGGAAKDYRDAGAFLRDLGTTLTALQTITSLDARSAYKTDIGRLVESIRPPVDEFVREVQPFEAQLGTVKDGRFRHLQSIPSKLKWHFSLSKKALALQERVGRYLTMINTLMQRLTVDILQEIQASQTSMTSTISLDVHDRLKTLLPEQQTALLAELSERDQRNQEAWRTRLEDLLENYFGSQRLSLAPGPSSLGPPIIRDTSPLLGGPRSASPLGMPYSTESTLVGEPELLRGAESLAVPELVDAYAPVLRTKYQAAWVEDDAAAAATPSGVSADWVVTNSLAGWWGRRGSEALWISSAEEADDGSARALSEDLIALARAAGAKGAGSTSGKGAGKEKGGDDEEMAEASFAAYRFERVDAHGAIPTAQEHLVGFVYSLLYQVGRSMASSPARAAPHHHPGKATPQRLDATRFISLDGRYASLDGALALLRDMLCARPRATAGRLLVVADGLEVLDFGADDALDAHVRALLDVLQDRDGDLARAGTEVKTLIVTAEHSQLLTAAIEPHRTVDVSLCGGVEGFFDRESFVAGMEGAVE